MVSRTLRAQRGGAARLAMRRIHGEVGRGGWTGMLLSALACVAGCAVNDWGVVRVVHSENATARVVGLQAWGAHVRVGVPDAGLTLGISRRTYVFARRDAPNAAVPLASLPEADARRVGPVPDGDVTRLVDLGTPLATIEESTGITLDVGRRRTGVSIGMRTRAAIELPPDESLILFLKIGTDEGVNPEVYVGKELQ